MKHRVIKLGIFLINELITCFFGDLKIGCANKSRGTWNGTIHPRTVLGLARPQNGMDRGREILKPKIKIDRKISASNVPSINTHLGPFWVDFGLKTSTCKDKSV